MRTDENSWLSFLVFIIDVIKPKRILKNSYCCVENNSSIRLLAGFGTTCLTDLRVQEIIGSLLGRRNFLYLDYKMLAGANTTDKSLVFINDRIGIKTKKT